MSSKYKFKKLESKDKKESLITFLRQKYLRLGYAMDYKKSRVAAIRMKCLDCVGGIPVDVSRCPRKKCPLWPHRTGRLTKRKRKMIDIPTKAEYENMIVNKQNELQTEKQSSNSQ